MGNSEGREKRKRWVWHSVALKLWPRGALGQTRGNCPDAADKQAQMLSTVAPVYRWSVSRRPPLTGVLGCFLCSSR